MGNKGTMQSAAQMKSMSLDMATLIRQLIEELLGLKETVSLIK